MKVFVTGATGLIGSHLVQALARRGDRVLALSRKPLPTDRFGPNCESVVGDPASRGPWLDRVAECDSVVHLAGENVAAHRWTDEVMKRIRESRIQSTVRIAEVLAREPKRANGQPKVWVSGSAIGYYGARGDEPLSEGAAPGSDFLAGVGVGWERAADSAAAAGVRVCHPRTGHVLDAKEGVLPTMARPFRFFAGGPIASGRQWMSWIHITDMVEMLLFALDTDALDGPFNATAPNPVRNREFSRVLARVLHRPYWMPVPKFALRIVVGKMAEVIVTGQRAMPTKVTKLGYSFRFPELRPALEDLLRQSEPATV